MTNKDNIELAWASYFYFDLVGKKFKAKDIKNTPRKDNPIITLQDTMDITYKDYEAVEIIQLGKKSKELTLRKLNGDMSPTQAKNFFKRYDLLIHQPNISSGFYATLTHTKFALVLR